MQEIAFPSSNNQNFSCGGFWAGHELFPLENFYSGYPNVYISAQQALISLNF